jgi:hypothetical protein
MNLPKANYFFDTIYHLRNSGQVILYDKIFAVKAIDERDVVELLQAEYENECLEYPYNPPVFDAPAALWGAKTIFLSAQLILHRETAEHELQNILPAYAGAIAAGAILSADVCLRFLPQVLYQLLRINPDDALRPILEQHLQTWHYSAIGCPLQKNTLRFDEILADKCLLQLYTDRVIDKKDKLLAQLPGIQKSVAASMGDLEHIFWKELNM